MRLVDKASGYVYGAQERANMSIMSVATHEQPTYEGAVSETF